MIGTAYQPAAMAAVIGPNHSAEIPAVLWGAWLDASDVVLAETGATVAHTAFGTDAAGVVNIAEVAGGTLPASAAKFALMDASSGGNIVAATDSIATDADPGDVVVFPAGSLTFPYVVGV